MDEKECFSNLSINGNIKNFCINEYLNSEMNPYFAILIKGKWGCGKTYLVKQFLHEHYGDEWEKNVIWLSTFGLSNIQQLQTKLYEKLHPILSSKLAKLTGTIAKSALKMSTGIDLNNNANDDFTLNITIPDIQDDEKNIKSKKLFIVDDIERCKIEPHELLGFFSDYILEENMKVIFIGNLEEVHNDAIAKTTDKDDNLILESKNKQEFDRIKEKVIGIEFEVEAEIESAINSFLEELKSEPINSIKEILASKCVEVLNRLDYKNLRTIRQAFFYMHRVLEILGEERTDENYISQMVEYFLVVFIQKVTNTLRKEDAIRAINIYRKYGYVLEKYIPQKNNPVEDGMLDMVWGTPLGSVLGEIIFDGIISKEDIIRDYGVKTNTDDKRTSLEKLVQEMFRMNDIEFKKLHKKVESDFDNNKFLTYQEVKQYSHIQFLLARNNLSTLTLKQVKDKIIAYIDQNKNSFSPDISLTNFYDDLELENIEELKDILKHFRENNQIRLIEEQKILLDTSINTKMNIVDMLISQIDFSKHVEISIFSNINIQTFYEKLIQSNLHEHDRVLSLLKDVYEVTYSNGKLKKQYFSDIEKIKEIQELYSNDSKEIFMSPESLQKKWYAEKYNVLYTWMKEHKEHKEQELPNV